MVTNSFSKETKETLNKLLGLMFQSNSIADNIAYALNCELDCPHASSLFHQGFAHMFPGDEFADKLSEIMIHEGVRPVRRPLHGDDDTYDNIVLAFEDCYRMMAQLKQETLDTIDFLEYDKNARVLIIELEDIAKVESVMLHQCDIWRQKAKAYFATNDTRGFDKDFDKFSNFDFVQNA